MNRVREVRRARGWTQRELARRAQLSLRTISSIEAGHRCQMPTKHKILRALGLTFDQRRMIWHSDERRTEHGR